MKKLILYKTRKIGVSILLVVNAALVITYVFTESWSDPNWILMISLLLNFFAIISIYLNSYKKTRIQLYNDKLVYRLAGQPKDEIIPIASGSQFSKDWKGIYVKNATSLYTISLNYINNKEGEKLFHEIKEFYAKK